MSNDNGNGKCGWQCKTLYVTAGVAIGTVLMALLAYIIG